MSNEQAEHSNGTWDSIDPKLTAEIDQLIVDIRERNPLKMEKRFQEALKSLVKIEQDSRPIHTWKDRLSRKESPEAAFRKRVETFLKFTDEVLFKNIQHGSPKDIPNQKLVSAEKRARDQGLDIQQVTKSSGLPDIEIGNTNYIFANHPWLRSNSHGGAFMYVLPPESSAYVAMRDIADVRTESLPQTKQEGRKNKLDLYLKNIFTLEQFRVLFATYCAICFESPEQLVTFVDQDPMWLSQDNCWKDDEVEPNRWRADEITRIRKKMRDVFRHTQLIPPLAPEFQYKEQVQGKLLNKSDRKDYEEQYDIVNNFLKSHPDFLKKSSNPL